MGELARKGLAIVMISSELPEILGMSDRIAVMRGGTIVATLDRADANQERLLELSLGPWPGRKRGRLMTGKYGREISVGLAYLAILGLLAVFAPRFFEVKNLTNFAVKNAPFLVASVGMTLVILARQIDISIGSQASICAVVAGMLAQRGLPMPVIALGAILAGATIGAINGGLVAGLGLPSIVVTLATLVIGRESLRYVREGATVGGIARRFPVVLASDRIAASGSWSVFRSRFFWSSPGACDSCPWDVPFMRQGRIPRPRGSRESGLGSWFSWCSWSWVP